MSKIPKAQTWMKIHGILAPIWFLLIIPTVIWWSESVLWIGLISCYANAVGHFSAWQGSRAEKESESD